MVIWLVACAVSAAPVAVVGLGDTDTNTIERVRTAEPNALTQSEMLERLTGTTEVRTPNAASLEQMLRDARDREARFDTVGANELRAEIARAFADSVRPTDEIRDVAARAAHDTAAALLAEGDEAGARRAARDATRMFPDTPLDATRHPPAVLTLFARAREQLAGSPRARLRVEVDTPGSIWVDGSSLGRTDSAIERDLATGPHRVWWVGDDGATSLPHRVDLSAGGATVTVAASLERAVRLLPAVAVDCTDDCGAQLRVLGRRLDAARVIGVRAGAAGLAVDVETGATETWPGAAVTSEVRARFSPWYLVPLGVGQFVQDRPLFGSGYAAAQVGLLVWHLVAWQRHADAVTNNDFGREPDLRSQRNLSAAFFYGSLAASVAEALIVGWVTGE